MPGQFLNRRSNISHLLEKSNFELIRHDLAQPVFLEVAEKVIRLTGSRSKIIFQPLPQDDPLQRKPDISLAAEKLGWVPAVNLEDGLRRTVAYFETIVRS